MLVDLHKQFNYDRSMPESGDAPPPPKTETATTPEIRAARQHDISRITEKLFREKVPLHPTAEQAQAIDAHPAAKKIFSSEYFGNLTKDQIPPEGIVFPDGNSAEGKMKGNPVFLTVDGEKARLVSIGNDQSTDVDSSDTLRCEVQIGEGDSAVRELRDISRQAIVEANLVAERDEIIKGFHGREQEVVESYLDSIDSRVAHEDKKIASDEAIQQVAKDHQMMSRDEAQAVVKLVAQEQDEIDEKLKALDERLVLAAPELQGLLGDVTEIDIQRKRSEMSSQMSELDKKIKAAKDKGDEESLNILPALATQKDAIQKQWVLLQKAGQVLHDVRTPVTSSADTSDITPDFTISPESGTATSRVIDDQIKRYTATIRDIPEDQQGSTEYLKQVQMLANLQMAQEATGPYGAILQQRVLEQVREASEVPQHGVERILRSGEFQAQVDQAQKNLENFFDTKNFSEDERKDIAQTITDPTKLEKLMEDKKFAQASQEMIRGFFGNNLADTEIDSLIQNLTDANNDLLATSFKHKLKEFFTTNKTKKLSLLAIILASLPVVAAGLAAATAAGALEVAGAGMRQR